MDKKYLMLELGQCKRRLGRERRAGDAGRQLDGGEAEELLVVVLFTVQCNVQLIGILMK